VFCVRFASSFGCLVFLQPATLGVVPTFSHGSQSGVVKCDLATPDWPTACTRLVAPSWIVPVQLYRSDLTTACSI
jgi:hypothetical protein